MSLYVALADIKLRLIGKVRFTTDDTDENKMFEDLAERLIDEAEGQVEQDLSPRYLAPFVNVDDNSFSTLPDRPTKETIRTMCELQAVSRILETDFGSGSAVNGEKYRDAVDKRYKEILEKLLAKKKDGAVDALGWRYPPLPKLKLNYMNTEADDGFAGRVIVASGSRQGSYPSEQMNSPGETFWNRFDTFWPW